MGNFSIFSSKNVDIESILQREQKEQNISK